MLTNFVVLQHCLQMKFTHPTFRIVRTTSPSKYTVFIILQMELCCPGSWKVRQLVPAPAPLCSAVTIATAIMQLKQQLHHHTAAQA